MQKFYGLMIALFALVSFSSVQAERVKDLVSIAGVRSNQLVGYGVVVGLDKSGDKTAFTGQSLRSMLGRMGVTLPPGVDPKSKNIAAVALYANLPAFAKPGQKIDVTVSSVGDAKSLRGGTLIMSPLKGADGKVYAIAQGSLIVNGLSASGLDGSRITVNNPVTGRIPNGATVERMVPTPFAEGDSVVFNLNSSDFTTAQRLVEAINQALGPETARPIDATSVRVNAPMNPSQRVSFVSMVENLTVSPDDTPAKIIVNSRTGTVVINSQVRVKPAAVSHGNLTVTISENSLTSQPEPLAAGDTEVTAQSDIKVEQGNSRMFVFNPGVNLNQIVNAVNNVGASPSDLVAILEALKSAGSLNAELLVI